MKYGFNPLVFSSQLIHLLSHNQSILFAYYVWLCNPFQCYQWLMNYLAWFDNFIFAYIHHCISEKSITRIRMTAIHEASGYKLWNHFSVFAVFAVSRISGRISVRWVSIKCKSRIFIRNFIPSTKFHIIGFFRLTS